MQLVSLEEVVLETALGGDLQLHVAELLDVGVEVASLGGEGDQYLVQSRLLLLLDLRNVHC